MITTHNTVVIFVGSTPVSRFSILYIDGAFTAALRSILTADLESPRRLFVLNC